VKAKLVQGDIPHLSREDMQKLGIDSMDMSDQNEP